MSEVPTVQNGKERERGSAEWIFQKSNSETAQLMNLPNISMLTSTAVKKMMQAPGGKPNPTKEATASLKSRIKAEFQKSFMEAKNLMKSGGGDHDSSATSATGNGNDGEDESKCPGKQKIKSQHYSGYSDAKKKQYMMEIRSIDEKESRHLTALDEVLCALRFAVLHIEAGEVEQKKKTEGDGLAAAVEVSGSPKRKKARKTMEEEPNVESDPLDFNQLIPKYEATLSFCVGIWFNFVFGGKVNINGRDCRIYSVLRTELQQVMIKSHEEFHFQIDAATAESGSSANGKKAASAKKPAAAGAGAPVGGMDALKLAEMLCSTFVDKPVLKVDLDAGEENQALNRIIEIVSTRADVVEPLTFYVEKNMHLPLTMHSAPRAALESLACSSSCSSMDLNDALAIILTEIEKVVPFSWLVLASDTAEIQAERGHFVEKTGKDGMGTGIDGLDGRRRVLVLLLF